MEKQSRLAPLQFRTYGSSGPQVVLLHGGPGAAGYMGPVARELEDEFQILEPFQRGSGAEPLTVDRHIADLHDFIASQCPSGPPALVGHSWGAMLALAYSAAHPGRIRCLVLIGCGTFDPISRVRMRAIREERMNDELRGVLQQIELEYTDPDERLAQAAQLMQVVDSYELIPTDERFETCDTRANRETWDDMIRLQEQGVYPAAFSAIHCPVMMLHGSHDPHPGPMIHASLKPYLSQLEYGEWSRCGHYPWLEKHAHDVFYSTLRAWLKLHSG